MIVSTLDPIEDEDELTFKLSANLTKIMRMARLGSAMTLTAPRVSVDVRRRLMIR